MNRRTLLLLTATALASSVVQTKAELPPSAYLEMQAKAAEVLLIKVDDVSSRPVSLIDWSKRIETVQATIQQVTRTKTGAKATEKITIRYERLLPKKGWAGPSPAPPLEVGKEYPAYLEKGADGVFELAAKGKSFTEVK